MQSGRPKRPRVTEAFLKMKKFDIAKLKQAYEGNQTGNIFRNNRAH